MQLMPRLAVELLSNLVSIMRFFHGEIWRSRPSECIDPLLPSTIQEPQEYHDAAEDYYRNNHTYRYS